MSEEETSGHLQPEVSDRGFTHLPPIPGLWGGVARGQARVYESSAADGPYVWMTVRDENGEAAVHMPLDGAERFAEQIMFFVRNHYQLDPTEEQP